LTVAPLRESVRERAERCCEHCRVPRDFSESFA